MQTLNVLSLITGLLTSVVAAIMMNGSYAEFAATLDRWEGDNNYGDYGRRLVERWIKENPDYEDEINEVNYGEVTYLLYMVSAIFRPALFDDSLCKGRRPDATTPTSHPRIEGGVQSHPLIFWRTLDC
jgi:hypothetical protein